MKKILPILIATLVIAGCTPTRRKKQPSSSSDEGTSLNPTSINPSVEPSISSQAPTSATSISSVGPTSASKPSSSQSKPSSTSASSSPLGPLPGGYPIFEPPTNTPYELKTSTSPDDWWNSDMKTEMPENWDYLYGQKILTEPDFYKNAEGGLAMDQHYKGFRTCLFHHNGPKLEIRFYVSQYNYASGGTPNKNVPTGYLFFFDNNGTYLSNLTYTVEHETFKPSSSEVQFYITGSGTQNVAYFEFRLNDLTFEGKKCYNFGISKVGIHSWQFV